ncbi:hypothetical protein V8B97DRAFT_1915601 [Scleroderma yunnanense]
MGGHCPTSLVDLSSPFSSSTPSLDSEPSLAQFNLQFWTLHGPRVPGTPLPDNPIPAYTLHNLTYFQMAATMADEIVALTGDAHGPWVCFFMAIKDDPANQHLYNVTASLHPVPDEVFFPIPVTPALHYYLLGKMDIPETHLLFGYWCFDCNHLGH